MENLQSTCAAAHSINIEAVRFERMGTPEFGDNSCVAAQKWEHRQTAQVLRTSAAEITARSLARTK